MHVQSLFHQVRFRSLLVFCFFLFAQIDKKKIIFLLKFLDRFSCLVSLKIMTHRMMPFHLGGIRLHQLFVTFFLHEIVSVHSNRVSMAPATPIDLNEIRHAVTSKRVVQSMSLPSIECAWCEYNEQKSRTTTSSFRSTCCIEIFAVCFLFSATRHPSGLIYISISSSGVISMMLLFLGLNCQLLR